jgi:hypothetical protein
MDDETCKRIQRAYSYRRARIGSIVVARRAGRNPAASATAPRSEAAITAVGKSAGWTLYN